MAAAAGIPKPTDVELAAFYQELQRRKAAIAAAAFAAQGGSAAARSAEAQRLARISDVKLLVGS